MRPKAKVEDAPVINFTPARDDPNTGAINCPSKAAGFCEICQHCYAAASERFPNVYNYRVRQSMATYEDLRDELKDILAKYPIEYVRFSESGDFRSEKDIETLAKLAKDFPELTFYGYTKKYDLMNDVICGLIDVPSNVVINVSGINFVWVDLEAGETPPPGYDECPCDMSDPEGARCIRDCTKCAEPDAHVWEPVRKKQGAPELKHNPLVSFTENAELPISSSEEPRP